MKRTIQAAILGLALLPGLGLAASPLRLECSAEQGVPGRALVCDYSMLGMLNARLADLHERLVAAGRAGRVEVRRWLAARDACREVDCLDRVFDAAIHDAKLALVDVVSREPAPVLVNARGVRLKVLPPPAQAPSPVVVVVEQSARELPPPREGSGPGGLLALLFAAGAVGYAIVAKRFVV